MTGPDLTEAPQLGEQPVPHAQAVIEDVDFDVLDRIYGVSTEVRDATAKKRAK